MIKNLLTFIKHDFVSQVFFLNVTLTLIYACSLFDEVSNLTISLCVLGLLFAGFSSHMLYKSKVTVRYELVLILPLSIFVVCLFFGVLQKYNQFNSFSELMTYSSLERLIDFGMGAMLFYGSFLALMGLSCSNAANDSFETPSSNIKIITGQNPDFIHYGITRHKETFMTLKNFTFCAQGLIRNERVFGFHELFHYLKDQNMRFTSLTDDDFLIMNMVKI